MADSISAYEHSPQNSYNSPHPTFTTQQSHTHSQHTSPMPAYSPLYTVEPIQEGGKPLGQHKGSLAASTVDYSHPDIQSPGLESAWSAYDGDAGKEVVPQPPYDPNQHQYTYAPQEKPPRRYCGCLPGWACILVSVLAVLAIIGAGLGVGLGVGLKKQ